MRFETSFGNIRITFRHFLPRIVLKDPDVFFGNSVTGNSLSSLMKKVKKFQGETQCFLTTSRGDEIDEYEVFGIAYTHPNDLYNREVGRIASLERALSFADLTKSEEREVIAGYYNR